MSAETDLQAAISAAIKIPNEMMKFLISNTPNYVTMEGNVTTAVPADATGGPEAVLAQLRAALFGQPVPAARSLIGAFLPAYARVLTCPDPNLGTIYSGDGILYALYESFANGSKTVKSRNMTRGSPSAGGSNSGNGSVVRLLKDRYDFAIEAGSPQVQHLTCIADEHTGGRRHGETFQIKGEALTRSAFPYSGQGGTGFNVNVLSINDSGGLPLANPGFEQYNSSDGSFPGWSVTSAWANFAQLTGSVGTNTYKDVLPNSTPGALKFLASDSIYQTFSAQAARWQPFVPMYAQIAWQRLASATGTLKLKIGGKEVTVDVSTGTNGVWNVLRWPAATPDKYAWYKNWNAQDAQVKVTMSSLATGTVVVDDLIIGPYNYYDGAWCALVGGPTPFLRDDVFTVADSGGADSIIQQWLERAFPGYYLPAVSNGSETWADPS